MANDESSDKFEYIGIRKSLVVVRNQYQDALVGKQLKIELAEAREWFRDKDHTLLTILGTCLGGVSTGIATAFVTIAIHVFLFRIPETIATMIPPGMAIVGAITTLVCILISLWMRSNQRVAKLVVKDRNELDQRILDDPINECIASVVTAAQQFNVKLVAARARQSGEQLSFGSDLPKSNFDDLIELRSQLREALTFVHDLRVYQQLEYSARHLVDFAEAIKGIQNSMLKLNAHLEVDPEDHLLSTEPVISEEVKDRLKKLAAKASQSK